MEHQEGAGEPRRHAREGGEPIHFGIAEFESNFRVQGHLIFKLTSILHKTSVLDILHMHGTLRR
jgi:hypothetical protein